MRASIGIVLLSLVVGSVGLWAPAAGQATATQPAPAAVAPSANLEEAIKSVSGVLSAAIQKAELKQVGVVEFGNAEGTLGGSIGSAGLYTSDRLERLMRIRLRQRVADGSHVSGDLRKAGVGVRDLSDKAGIQRALGKMGNVDSLVTGVITRTAQEITITARVVRLSDGADIAAATARAPIDTNLLSLFGVSFADVAVIKTAGKGIMAASKGLLTASKALMTPSKGIEVLVLDPDSHRQQPFGIEVQEFPTGKALPLYKHEGQGVVPARDGQRYQIHLRNNFPATVGVTLTVDGLNVLYCRRDLIGPLWVLEPNETLTVEGWQDDGNVREFVFADAGQSLAARDQFTELAGQITARFYLENPNPKAGGMGTAKGRIVKKGGTKTVDLRILEKPYASLTVEYDSQQVVERYDRVAPANARTP